MTLAIDRRADLWGERTAVVDHQTGERLSYADLAVLIDATAARLSALGIGAGDALAAVSRNRVEVLGLLFAARRVGAVFAPVSHRLTPATAEPAIRQVDPALVVHETAQRDLVGGIEPDRLVSFEELDCVEGTGYERRERDPGDPLWYLRTDESDRADDGDDRVVVVPERQVEWNCVTAAVAWGLDRKDAAPILVPFASADGLLRLALPLLYVGGRVVVQRAADPEDTLALVDGGLATRLFGSRTVLRELAAVEGFADADWSAVAWVASDEPLEPAVADAFRVQGIPVVRSYGRPEAGPNALFVPTGLADGTEPPGAVGRPFPDAEVRIVDADGEPVAPGTGGNLHVGGRVVASGYLDGGGEAFDDGEFDGGVFREGWVATGDRARLDPESGFVLLEGERTGGDESD